MGNYEDRPSHHTNNYMQLGKRVVQVEQNRYSQRFHFGIHQQKLVLDNTIIGHHLLVHCVLVHMVVGNSIFCMVINMRRDYYFCHEPSNLLIRSFHLLDIRSEVNGNQYECMNLVAMDCPKNIVRIYSYKNWF